MRSIAVLSTVTAAVALTQANASVRDYTFEKFEVEFSKSYASPMERAAAEIAFYKNLAEIVALNEKSQTASFGVNRFADMSDSQFSSFTGKARITGDAPKLMGASESAPVVDISQLPKEKNWLHALSPVKNQAKCGSCWAFAAVETIEAAHTIATGEKRILSPQQMVDCVPNPNKCGGVGGCHGLTTEIAFDWALHSEGVVEESAYPYKAAEGTCAAVTADQKTVKVTGWKQLQPNRYDLVMNHIANVGPVTIAISAAPFKFYKGGVLTTCATEAKENIDINHGVQLVGYGTDDATGLDYWLVRNSWGENWGESGFIKVLRNKPHEENFCLVDSTPAHGVACEGEDWPVVACGHCGLLFDVAYATVENLNADAEEIRM